MYCGDRVAQSENKAINPELTANSDYYMFYVSKNKRGSRAAEVLKAKNIQEGALWLKSNHSHKKGEETNAVF